MTARPSLNSYRVLAQACFHFPYPPHLFHSRSTRLTPNISIMASVQKKDEICAIFIHAGAGFHSVENERKHLKACEK